MEVNAPLDQCKRHTLVFEDVLDGMGGGAKKVLTVGLSMRAGNHQSRFLMKRV
jgi:hypothetical protein